MIPLQSGKNVARRSHRGLSNRRHAVIWTIGCCGTNTGVSRLGFESYTDHRRSRGLGIPEIERVRLVVIPEEWICIAGPAVRHGAGIRPRATVQLVGTVYADWGVSAIAAFVG